MDPHTVAEHVTAAQNDLRLQQKAYLARHPEYDQALWIFAPESKLRSWCQHVVASSYGERLQGHAPSLKLWYAVSTITYACTLVIVIVACLVTPIYQKAYRLQDGQSGVAWYTWLDLSMCIVFTLEASCKICADGFYLTPNGYLRNLWNKIDFVVVGTLWINVVADLMDNGSVSRKVRAFKALRALRLVNVSDKTKEIFFDVFIAGFWNMLGAAISALSILIPMAVWAQNMFSGLLAGCNDSDVADKAACKNEFLDVSSPWPFLVPRQWDNPRTFSFDNFGRSLLVLFEITSQEGWTAVANSAAAITGRELQPQEDAAPRFRLFWVLFNIVGSVGVLTVFIAVILQNYRERSGLALYTTEQRSWAEIKSLLSQVRPSRRPADAPMAKWRRLAFFAVRKHSSWQRFILSTHVVHSVLLMTEHFPKTTAYTTTRNLLFFVILMIYVVNMAVRLLGLGWTLFWRGRWNIFNLAVLPMAIATSILTAISEDVLYLTLQKVSLVLLTMNLIREIDSLDILAKVAVASIPALASVLATWLVCFITFAIACNQILGLVKLGEHGHHNLNFRTVGKSLVSLYRMSLGEGWNALMHDYTIREPYCTDSSDFYLSDCGNAPWAYFLFISWNLLSMYIFVNVLLSIVFNNFSYVYQRASIMGKISREEIRKFKHSWAQFDDGTGRIRCNDVGKFLHSLTGIFETKIYPDEQSVYNILSKCCIGLSETRSCIDLAALNKQLDTLDVSTIRERRLALNCIFMELTESDSISFNRALLVLAYNKFVDQSKSLQLLEFFKRREIRIRLLRSTREQQVVRFLECAWIKHLHARKRNNRKEDALLSRIDTQFSTRLSRRIQGNTYANNHDSSNFISRSASQRACSEEQAMRDLMQASAWAPALAEEASRSEARPI